MALGSLVAVAITVEALQPAKADPDYIKVTSGKSGNG